MTQPATFNIEKGFWNSGVNDIAGVDEVGRGAWAGPVVAAAVIFPKKVKIPEDLFDSKSISPRRREYLSKVIYKHAKSIGIGSIDVAEINKRGIGSATHKAFREAIKSLSSVPESILVDAFYIKHLRKSIQRPIKKGDSICASIAAASIVAKVYRDRLMKKLSSKYPVYRFAKNKGYGTAYHMSAIAAYHFTDIHRVSFNLSYLIQ